MMSFETNRKSISKHTYMHTARSDYATYQRPKQKWRKSWGGVTTRTDFWMGVVGDAKYYYIL